VYDREKRKGLAQPVNETMTDKNRKTKDVVEGVVRARLLIA
jgi:hypothetical protein